MTAITKWAGIKWSDSLLESTFCGKNWTGNSDQIMQGLNRNKINQIIPKNFFEKNDLIVYQSFFPYRMKLYGYYDNSYSIDFSRIALFFRILVPTNAEYNMLKSLVNIRYIYSIYLFYKNPNKIKHYYLKKKYLFNNLHFIVFISYIDNLFNYPLFYLKRINFYLKIIKNRIPDSKKNII